MAKPQKQLFPMMTASVKLCQFVGLWFDVGKPQLVWRALFTIGCMTVWFILPTVAFIVRKEKLLTVQLKPILELFFTLVFVLRLSSHVLYRRTLWDCYQDLQEAFSEFTGCLHEDVSSVLKHLKRSAYYLVKIYVAIVLLQATSYGFADALVTIYKHAIGDESLVLSSTVLEADFVFFDHLSNFRLWLPTMLTGLVVQYMMIVSLLANECLLWNLLHHVSCLFRIVQMEVSRLDHYRDPQQFHERLSFIVNVHEVCYRNARRLESVLSPIMGLLYCFCVFQICYAMFVLIVVDDVILIASMIFVLQYTVFLIFSFSMLGTELTEASASVSMAIYNTSWFERPASEQRLLLFMKARSDRASAISAANFFPLNRSTFGVAMKTAYSYFTIMCRLYSKQK